MPPNSKRFIKNNKSIYKNRGGLNKNPQKTKIKEIKKEQQTKEICN